MHYQKALRYHRLAIHCIVIVDCLLNDHHDDLRASISHSSMSLGFQSPLLKKLFHKDLRVGPVRECCLACLKSPPARNTADMCNCFYYSLPSRDSKGASSVKIFQFLNIQFPSLSGRSGSLSLQNFTFLLQALFNSLGSAMTTRHNKGTMRGAGR